MIVKLVKFAGLVYSVEGVFSGTDEVCVVNGQVKDLKFFFLKFHFK